MLYLLLSIVSSTLLILILKSFESYNVKAFQAIVFNYLTAALLGFLNSDIRLVTDIEIWHAPWMKFAFILGCTCFSSFYVMSITTQRIGITVTAIANKMSMIIPVIIAIAFYNNRITFVKIAGITMALFAIYFTSKKTNPASANNSAKSIPQNHLWLFPLIVFLAGGTIDSLINFVQVKYLQENHFALFTSFLFAAAFIGSFTILSLQLISKKDKLSKRSIVGGIVLGIPNYYSIYFMVKALDTHFLESSVFYPINNLGVICLSGFAAYLLFKERISMLNVAGIILSLVAILCIAFA